MVNFSEWHATKIRYQTKYIFLQKFLTPYSLIHQSDYGQISGYFLLKLKIALICRFQGPLKKIAQNL